MSGINYYLLSALPGLGEPGSTPPITRQELYKMVSASPAAARLLEALFLGDDLLQRQALLAGQDSQPEPLLLTPSQIRGEQPLPDFLTIPSSDAPRRIPEDQIWTAYYHWAAQQAKQAGSRFLARWIAQEVALRNALVLARAKALELEPSEYLVADELAEPDADFTALLNEWGLAKNPLQGERLLDDYRWRWLKDHESWFRFTDDELLAYAAQLMLLERWHRLNKAEAQEQSVQK